MEAKIDLFRKHERDEQHDNRSADETPRFEYLTQCILGENVSIKGFSLFLYCLVTRDEIEPFHEELFEYVAKNTYFDVNAVNEDGFALLHFVAEYGTPRCIKALIDVGANPNVLCKFIYKTPLWVAIYKNRNEIIQCLVDCGASLYLYKKYPGSEEEPLLLDVIFLNRFEIVKILVRSGADVNEFVNDTWPLQLACEKVQNVKMVEFLLTNGARADLNRHNKLGESILDIACKIGNFKIAKLLLNHGAKLNQGHVFNTLHYAAMGRNPNIIRHLLKLGANVNYRCKEKISSDFISPVPRTALEFVIIYAQANSTFSDILEIMKLLKYEASINLADPVRGETLLHLAYFSNRSSSFRKNTCCNTNVIRYLLKNNANVNALDFTGQTPFHHAFSNFTRKSRHHMYSRTDGEFELKVLVAFIALKIEKKERVIEANLKLLRKFECLPIYEACVEELNKMKKNICKSLNFTFLNVLTRDIDVLGRALTNQDLLQVLNEGSYITEFPIYAIHLEERISEAQLLHQKVELASKFFYKILKKSFHDGFVEICKYLSVTDLENFVEGFSNITV